MTFPPLCTAAGDPNASPALYVILAGVVCTGIGWWLRGWHAKQAQSEARTEPAPEPARESEEALQEERGKLAGRLAAMESAIAGAEAARNDALRELEVLRPKVASHDEALERAGQLERAHRKALEDLTASESALKAARLAEGEARAGTAAAKIPEIDPARLEEAERQLSEIGSLETAAREAAAAALQEGQAATELNTRLLRELEETRTAVAEARAAATSEQDRAGQLVKELDEARGRIAAIESAPSVPQVAHAEPDTSQENPAEATTRAALEKAMEEGRSMAELNACLRRELDESHSARQEASAAAASEQTRATLLAGELEEARARIASLQAAPSPPPETPAANSSQEQLDETLQAAEAARRELKAAHEEIRRLKSELSSPKPRPILTSPRPEGGPPAPQP